MQVDLCFVTNCLSMQERKLFDEKFIRLDTRRLCELTSAADALDMKPLVDLTSRALARMIEGKSADEIRWAISLPGTPKSRALKHTPRPAYLCPLCASFLCFSSVA